MALAPELARHAVLELPTGSKLLDPMCGSGVVLRTAVEHGVEAVGVDIDPLAVLMAKVWSRPLDRVRMLHDAHKAVEQAKRIEDDATWPEWHDEETRRFVEFWFAPKQRRQLAAFARVLFTSNTPSTDALYVAMSRTIITKDRGASLARDVSHSRPHKSWQDSDYDVYLGFLGSCRAVASKHASHLIRADSAVMAGDSRNLSHVSDSSVDAIVTSPPYLNAIDYIRGHRLSLVWMGYTCAQTKGIRSASIGAERAGGETVDVDRYIVNDFCQLPERQRGWIRRYYSDAAALVGEIARVGRSSARVVIVVGDSYVRNCWIKNATIFEDLLQQRGFCDFSRIDREIPARRRYLPPPTGSGSPLDSRMRNEVVLMATCP